MKFRYESEMRETVCAWFRSLGMTPAVEVLLSHYADIVAARWGDRPAPRRRPPLLDAFAVELKMHDVAGGIRQAVRNQHYCSVSYVAFPAQRIMMMGSVSLQRFSEANVGILGVHEDGVSIVFAPDESRKSYNERFIDKLWRRTRKDYQEVHG